MIAHALLTSQYYEADCCHIHTLLVQLSTTVNWIHPIAHHQDGHHDMLTLHNHYTSEGNSTHCIASAKHIQMTLYYKSECALPFSKFLDSLQKMFTVFQEEGEPLTEQAKVNEVLTKVQHPSLMAAIAQLCYQLNTEGITFMVAANHLNSAISQTPDYQMTQNIKSTNTSNHDSRNGCSGGYRPCCKYSLQKITAKAHCHSFHTCSPGSACIGHQ